MTPLLWRHQLRSLFQHPWQLAVPVLGVALGVASFVALDLARGSALASFERSTASVVGRATHQIVSRGPGVPDAFYRELRVERGLRSTAPVVEGSVTLGGRAFTLLGIDPLADAPFRDFAPSDPRSAESGPGALAPLLARPGAVLASSETARELGLAVGAGGELGVGQGRAAITLVGTLVPSDALSRAALADLLVADVATAQELLGQVGRLSRIDVILSVDKGPGEAELAAALPDGLELVPAARRGRAVAELTRAFRINLMALSLLGLVVGMFLIYSALTFSVVRRRELFGRLKSLGVTRREILQAVLSEGLVIGALGTLLGLAGGVWLAETLLAPITQTLNDLYVAVRSGGVELDPRSLALGTALGLAATVAASALPALEAASTPATRVLQRSHLESRTRARAPALALAGVGLFAACGALLAFSGGSLVAGLVAIFVAILGYALLLPFLTLGAARALVPLLRHAAGSLGAFAVRGVAASLSRTGVAIAALAVAVSVSIGFDIMVQSFRATVDDWLSRSLAADIYAAVEVRGQRAPSATLPLAWIERAGRTEGVARVSTNRRLRVESEYGPVWLAALGIGEASFRGLGVLEGDPARAWQEFRTGAVLVSEPLAWRHGLAPGGRVALATPRGEESLRIAAVVRDFTSDQGLVLMHRTTYDRLYDDDSVSAIAIEVGAGATVDGVIAALRATVPPDATILVRSNRALREASLEVFDRTFAVTGVLRAIAICVAFIGVVGALLALALEREQEVAILRATGLLPRQVRGLVLLQTGLLGLFAGVLSLPLGVGVAALLVHVINRRAFGWTLDFTLRPEPLAQAVAIALAAALVAGLYPALRMARVRVAQALHQE